MYHNLHFISAYYTKIGRLFSPYATISWKMAVVLKHMYVCRSKKSGSKFIYFEYIFKLRLITTNPYIG